MDEVLCYGWIDGQKKKYDEVSYTQKFRPRRARSMWSKRNIEHVARLTDAGLMMSKGFAEVELAKADGRWQVAYDTSTDLVLPDDFLRAVRQNEKTEAFYESLNKTNRYAIAWRLQTARNSDIRKRRFDILLEMLHKGEKLY